CLAGGPDNRITPHVTLVGLGGAGPWVAAARAQSAETRLPFSGTMRAAIDTAGFRFAKLKSARDINFLPGIVKYGDLPALLALSTQPMWLAGEGAEGRPPVTAAYGAAKHSG